MTPENEHKLLEALMSIAINLKRQADAITEARDELREIRRTMKRIDSVIPEIPDE